MSEDFEVKHIVKKNLKNIYLKVSKEDGLIIKSPKITKKYLNQIIEDKKEWVLKMLKELEEKEKFKDNSNTFIENSKILYLGDKYPFEIVICRTNATKIVFKNDIFYVFTPQSHKDNKELFIKKLYEFYKNEAKIIIPKIVDEYSIKMDLAYKSISYRKTKRRWGSCSFDDKLNFSTNLIKCPTKAIRSVVIHELAHIKHKNHSKKFYDLLKIYDSQYKQIKKELANYV